MSPIRPGIWSAALSAKLFTAGAAAEEGFAAPHVHSVAEQSRILVPFAQSSNAKTFDDAMTGMTLAGNDAVLSSYDFSSIRKIVDVGGGLGSLIASILKINPQMKGILFDAPPVIEGARRRIEAEGIADRCEVIAGDFFESVPSGGDAYILKWIIHDWSDERAIAILRNCHRVMTEYGKLLLVEAVVPRSSEPHFSKFIDLNMLVMTGGRERTEHEYRTLLEASGFRLTRIIATESPMSVIEGERV